MAYPVVKLWVDKDTGNILKRQDFALSGRLMRTSYYPKWKKLFSESKKADVWYPQEIRIYDEVEKANSTVIVDQDRGPAPARGRTSSPRPGSRAKADDGRLPAREADAVPPSPPPGASLSGREQIGGMNGLISLSLSLWLGQMPIDAASQEAALTVQQRQVEELQARLQLLQVQMQSRQQVLTTRLQDVEQQQQAAAEQSTAQQAAAEQLETSRQEQMAGLERGYQWLVRVEQMLQAGELSIGPALISAQTELSSALASASNTGQGETVTRLQRALDRLATVAPSVGNRDTARALLVIQDAGFELRTAWQLSTNRSSASLVNP